MTSRTIDFVYKIIRGGADYGFLRAIGGPSIRCDDGASIKMSFSGTFAPEARDAAGEVIPFEPMTDEISPILVIDGQEHPLGVFLPATVEPFEAEGVQELRIEAYDRCWLVRDCYTDGIHSIPAGTPYLTAIEALLTAAGVQTVLATPSTATISETREDWDIGTSYLTIVNDLLGEINYNPLWFNSSGIAILEPISVPTVDNIEHTLDADKVESLLVPQISRRTDVFQAPNVFVIVCANPDKGADMVARAENTNPQSPLSIPRRGRQIVSVERVDNIASQAELDAYAARRRNESMTSGETIEVTTALLPGWGVADVTALHYGEINNICIERQWEMTLQLGGTMHHVLEKVVYSLG